MQHNIRDPNRDHSHGRIYRVTYPGRPLLKPAKMKGKPIDFEVAIPRPEFRFGSGGGFRGRRGEGR